MLSGKYEFKSCNATSTLSPAPPSHVGSGRRLGGWRELPWEERKSVPIRSTGSEILSASTQLDKKTRKTSVNGTNGRTPSLAGTVGVFANRKPCIRKRLQADRPHVAHDHKARHVLHDH